LTLISSFSVNFVAASQGFNHTTVPSDNLSISTLGQSNSHKTIINNKSPVSNNSSSVIKKNKKLLNPQIYKKGTGEPAKIGFKYPSDFNDAYWNSYNTTTFRCCAVGSWF
jgi:hypothetical protein